MNELRTEPRSSSLARHAGAWGLGFTVLLEAVCIIVSMANPQFGWWPLWNVWLCVKLVPAPVVGHGQAGNPIYEWTPVQDLLALVGLLVGVIVYWLLFRAILRASARWPRPAPGD